MKAALSVMFVSLGLSACSGSAHHAIESIATKRGVVFVKPETVSSDGERFVITTNSDPCAAADLRVDFRVIIRGIGEFMYRVNGDRLELILSERSTLEVPPDKASWPVDLVVEQLSQSAYELFWRSDAGPRDPSVQRLQFSAGVPCSVYERELISARQQSIYQRGYPVQSDMLDTADIAALRLSSDYHPPIRPDRIGWAIRERSGRYDVMIQDLDGAVVTFARLSEPERDSVRRSYQLR